MKIGLWLLYGPLSRAIDHASEWARDNPFTCGLLLGTALLLGLAVGVAAFIAVAVYGVGMHGGFLW